MELSKPKVPKLNSKAAYWTQNGAAYVGDSRELLEQLPNGSINLVITSPPFALLRTKSYGNKPQEEYIDWLMTFAEIVKRKLREDGSFVIDLGGAYERGSPTRSLYNFRVLIRLCDELGFVLAEDFYWFNPSKLPSPIEWVNRKLRAKDSVNTIWWLGKTAWPKANCSNVLTEYSDRMKKLLEDPEGFYKPAKRPSGHDITEKFGTKDNGGAIPSNLLQIPNSESNGQYTAACKAVGADRHPARFPPALPQFFIRFLTDPNDLVVDIFAGSNTTGMVAEAEGRRWLAMEESPEYVAASSFRFVPKELGDDDLRSLHTTLLTGESVDLTTFEKQLQLFS